MKTTYNLFERFQERLTSVGGEAHSVDRIMQAAEIMSDHPALTKREVVVAPDFARSQSWAAILPLLHDQGIEIHQAESPASVADAPAGLSLAELAIAETGSVLLAENALELTKTGSEQQRYISLVTGPSRTADIERTLTIGVQGPKALCVIVVG